MIYRPCGQNGRKMITTEQIKALQQRVDVLGKCIGVEAKRAEVAQKQERTLAADFWDDPKEAEKFLKELSGVKFWVTGFDKVSSEVEDLQVQPGSAGCRF